MNCKKTFGLLATLTAVGSILLTGTAWGSEAGLIEADIINLRDAFTQNLGEEVYAGTAITENELNDPNLMALVTKHFNAVTLGNELKPDAIFGYSNHKCPELISYDMDGEEFIAPKMDFSRADRMLKYIQNWNEENPDRKIKVRGHVLVWHSQTPEWFFHEDYDKEKDYVSPEEMTKRQEWYIKEVLGHCLSEYKDLFYGWDVVNEAISDATGTYRTDEENSADSLSDDTHGSKSSWWRVYHSNEYIINAFKFANKYASEDVELYYNDYNECNPLKSNGIIQLLEDVKAADGTRLDGMGMQGHYDMTSPTGGQVKVAARRYAEVAGSVSITELDLKASDSYDASDEQKEKEFRRQYMKYKEIYQGISELIAEGVKVRTITVWGVIDRNSWLQTFNNVGGGASGTKRQCPLLFDDNYKAKPSFYALCNEPMPEVIIAKEEPEGAKESTEENEEADANEEEAKLDKSDAKEQIDTANEEKAEEVVNEAVEESTKDDETTKEDKTNTNKGIIVAVITILIAVGVYFIYRKKDKNGKEK